jgi:hypothetical protein
MRVSALPPSPPPPSPITCASPANTLTANQDYSTIGTDSMIPQPGDTSPLILLDWMGGLICMGMLIRIRLILVDSFGLRMSGRNNPYEYGRNKGKRRNIDGLTTSFEAHFVLGGGQHKIRCCDRQSDEILIHKYRKNLLWSCG